MKLKMLFAPLLAVLTVYLIIVRVIPAYFGPTGVGAINKNLQKINAKVADIEKKSANAAELANSLSYNANQQTIIRRYLPEEKKDEEVISSLSSMAAKESISITSIDVKESSTAPIIAGAIVNELPTNPNMTSADVVVVDMVDISNEKFLQKFDVEIAVMGSYDNIKKFILDLTTLKRFNDISSLEIAVDTENEWLFKANVGITFNYLSKITSVLNVDGKIFADKNFDMSVISEIENKTSAEVSTVNVGELGRTNPFAL
jgi:Tfp pilus assembly protein PilO